MRARFGAKGDGLADDTQALQSALDAAAVAGGAQVRLAPGVYRVSGLRIGRGCILRGADRRTTSIEVSQLTDAGAIVVAGGPAGLAGLTLRFQASTPPGSKGALIGGATGPLFLHDLELNLLRTPDVSAMQLPYYVAGPGPMLIANCRLFISSRNQWDHNVRNRVTFRDNVIDMHDGLGLCMSSEKLLVLRNELVFHAQAYAGQMNGFFFNEGWMGWNIYNAYIADNVAHDLIGPGDCQPYAADSAWSCMAGHVSAATDRSADVRSDLIADFKGLQSHEMEALIVQGRGLGQIRRVVAKENLGGSPATVRFTVAPAWDVPPDRSSVISTGSWHLNNVFAHNVARGSKSPYNMYYGGCYDCIDADAVSENTDGWNNWGRIGEMPNGSNWHTPIYFSQVRRSTFTGKAPPDGSMGIVLRTENETKIYRGIADYGTELRDNVIDRSACPDKQQRFGGAAAIATFNQSWMKVTPETPLIFAALSEGNLIRNSTVGFDLDGSFAFAIRGTRYQNCPKQVNDLGYNTAILAGAPDPRRAAR